MRMRLQLAVISLLTGAMSLPAQVSNPDKLIAPPPQAPSHLKPQPTDDLQWLWQYAKPAPIGRANDLRLDQRFQALLAREFSHPQAMWGTDPENHAPLATIIPLFTTEYGAVTAEQNRYLTIDGCVPTFCPAAGLLWIDLGVPNEKRSPLMIFAAVNWSSEGHTTDDTAAEYNLWVYPNHNLDPNALPLALTESIAHWNIRLAAAHRLVPHIAHALLVEPNGSPYALDPQLAGANTIAPQPDTTTQHADEN